MITLQRKYHFYAAHRNKGAGEKCGRIHGHTYKVVCSFEFNQINSDTGATMLFQDVDKIVEPIIKSLDHYLLLFIYDRLAKILHDAGEKYLPVPFETSCENLAIYLWDCISAQISNLSQIELQETESSNIIYRGGHITRGADLESVNSGPDPRLDFPF